jgi:hypothetical protein
MARLTKCWCGSGEFPEAVHDGHGIFLCYVCSKCKREKLSRFRPDIFERYETDEQIEED